MVEVSQGALGNMAVFEGSLVNLKNSPTHKSVVLQIEVPEEYGEAIVRAFGWPTRVKPLPVAVARLEVAGEAPQRAPDPPAEPRRFESLTPAEQAGIVCKDFDFSEFLRTTAPYKHDALHLGLSSAELVRRCCGVTSRKDIKEGTESGRQWRVILQGFRAWQDERNRTDPGV